MPLRLKKSDIAYRKIGDEFYVLTLPDNMLHNVRGVGVRILELLDGGKDENEIVEVLAEEYDAPADQIAADLRDFLEELAIKGIISRDGE